MSLILEFGSPKFSVIEEKKDDKGGKYLRASAIWQRANTINSNRRLYPRRILEREIKRLEKDVKAGQVLGMSHHPPDAHGQVRDVSHVWESISIDKDGVCRGTLTVIPTDEGRNIQELIKAGVKIPLSSRGVGSLTKKEKKVGNEFVEYDEVNDDFKIISPGDFVMSPSVEGAGLTEIIEHGQKQRYILTESDRSVLREFKEKKDAEKPLSLSEFNELVEGYLEVNFLTSEYWSPSKENFEKYKQANEQRYRKLLAERLQKEGIVLSEEITKGKKKVEKVEETKLRKDVQLYREALAAGFTGSYQQWAEKYAKITEVKQPNRKQLTESDDKLAEKALQRLQVKTNFIAGKSERKHYKKLED